MALSRRSRRPTTSRRLGKRTLSPCCSAPLPTRAAVARSKARQHSLAHGHLAFAIIWTTRWLPLSADRSRRYCHRCQHDGARQVCPVAIADEGHHRSQQDHDARSRRRASSPGSAAATLPSFRARPSPDENGGIPPTREGIADRSGTDEVDRARPDHHDAECDRSPTAMSLSNGMGGCSSSCGLPGPAAL